MKKSKKIIFFLSGLCLITLVVVFLFLLVPKTYKYNYTNSTTIAFIYVFPKSILKIEIDPACEYEVQEATPSPGFGVAYKFCHKRKWSKLLIESTSVSDGQKTYILKYAEPGEKGDSYREKIVQTEENIFYNTKTYVRTSPLVFFLFFK